jgi:hypothetical protein
MISSRSSFPEYKQSRTTVFLKKVKEESQMLGTGFDARLTVLSLVLLALGVAFSEGVLAGTD